MAAELTIAPGILVAMPQLNDPNFRRSVILVAEHNEEGSFGLILNKPTEDLVCNLISSLEMDWCGDEQAEVWTGGPVQPETGWVLHEPVPGLGEPATREIFDGVHLTAAPGALAVLVSRPPPRMRVLLGYAGWGPGQLESELTGGSWVNAPLSADLVFDTPCEYQWEASVRLLGVDPEALAPASGIH